ncbi:MAG: UDP-N-acetylmuramoyl-L-alanine--D-glutamate ligase, partial [Alphaproteobacteria bacterium]|nr:UDP-N-acetylmuramoyl-L-alanine--D-glutamate ligase [Alphaproteobacteria bacterium]
MNIKGKRYAIFGLGKSGLATAKFLLAQGAVCVAWDDEAKSREKFAQDMNITDKNAQILMPPEAWDWTGLTALVLSPGIPHHFPMPHAVAELAQNHGTPIIGDIALLVQAAPEAKYIGITGTNGKSTTTSLIGYALQQIYGAARVAIGGNLGTAALDLPILGSDGIYVLELSSYQLELNRNLPLTAAVLLNITPDHLARHGGWEGYVAAKKMIFDGMDESGLAVIALGDPMGIDQEFTLLHNAFIQAANKPTLTGVNANPNGRSYNDPDLNAEYWIESRAQHRWVIHNSEDMFDLADATNLRGWHNAQNALAACAVLRHVGLTPRSIAEAFKTFPGLAHRQENVGQIANVQFINDSKATNEDAAYYALVTYPNIYWLAGGRAKESGIRGLTDSMKNVSKAFLFGECAGEFAATLAGNKIPYQH